MYNGKKQGTLIVRGEGITETNEKIVANMFWSGVTPIRSACLGICSDTCQYR